LQTIGADVYKSDLSTKYLGLELKHPIILSASNLTSKIDRLIEAEKAGYSAVVLKSLFEEEIKSEVDDLTTGMEDEYSAHADAYDYLHRSGENHFISEYLKLIADAKKSLSIPVIASLNCVSSDNWLEYAKKIEAAGADALEINIFIIPANREDSSQEIERSYIKILQKVKSYIKLPITLKIGSHFSGLAQFLHILDYEGADGLVLFNRYYRPDINIKTETIKAAPGISKSEENRLTLHWTALMSGELNCDISASTGIHTGEDVIKMLLVGAKSVQVCSTAILNGLPVVQKMLKELDEWMVSKSYTRLADFNGKLCQENSENPAAYERSQYLKLMKRANAARS
jgi:dihydroorotate dehydrogenase (fumarate)